MDRPARILLVEDSPTQALKLRHVLEQAGLGVECAASAEAALDSLNRGLPDLVVTDYRLPGMLGDELCRKIRMNVNTRGIPILMLTAAKERETERHVLESGADDYVPKSEDLDFALLRIQALLRKSHVQEVVFSDESPFAATKLLVVDDSPTYLQLLAGQLEKEGWVVKTATTGAEALECAAVETFDGIVLDLVLPDLSGAELCRRLAEGRRTLEDSFVILALSGGRAKERMTSVLAAGADDVVEKSRDIAVIKARIRALLRRKLLYRENRRIADEFQKKELEILRARADKEAAELRAAMAEQLEKANRDLETANRELRETQAQLIQSAKMASLGQLVAGVAHEINNPLSFVMSHQATVERALEAIAAEAAPHLSAEASRKLERARERLGDIQMGLERIRDLVVKLRTFSRLDEGELKYVKIEESIESVLTLLDHRLAGRIRVTREYGDVKVVSCYPGPLNQVLMNVLANAIDAIDGAGEITIRTGRDGSMLRITVADTGKGMPENVRERVFDPFFTTKPVGEGTGLGLSISYGIIQRHNGTIEVRSAPGRGTEVAIRIPIGPEQANARSGHGQHD